MKTKFLSTILIVISFGSMAQFAEQKTVVQKNEKGIVRSVEYSIEDKSVSIPKSAEMFFRDVLEVQAADHFEKVSQRSKKEGFVNEHFEQYYNGVNVQGAGYVFHYQGGEMFFAHGNYVKIEDMETKPTLTAEDAKAIFSHYKEIPTELMINPLAELMIKEIPLEDENIPKLVYKVTLGSDHSNNTEFGYVSAQTGEVLFTEPILVNVSAVGTFETRYSGTRQAHTDYLSNSYRLYDNTRGTVIHTRNLNGGTNLSNSIELTDNDNIWTAAEHKSNNNDMGLDVHWALQQIYDRLYNVHGINGYNNAGFPINAYVKYESSSSADNAYWNPANRTLLFGAGFSMFHPLASVDVVAHEFGHGITDFQIGWGTTSSAQGALNEGLSDIWGAIMRYRITPNQSTWLIGSQVIQSSSYNCLRNLQSTNDSRAHTKTANTVGSTQYNSTADIYVRGGVFSHWFYLLVNGGSGTNGINNSYTVHRVGMDVAEDLIVEAVFNGFLRYTTDYSGLRAAFTQAATALKGAQAAGLVQQIENAWYAVGVGAKPSQITLSGSSVLCGSGTYTIEGLPSNATVTWLPGNYLTVSTTNGPTTVVGRAPSNVVQNSAALYAVVAIPGLPDVTIYKDILLGSFDHSKISTLKNGTMQTGAFSDVITYCGEIAQLYNIYGITSGGWNSSTLKIRTEGVSTDYYCIENTSQKLRIYNNAPPIEIKVQLKGRCGWSEWVTIEYNKLSIDGPIYFSDPSGAGISYSPNPVDDELTIDFLSQSVSTRVAEAEVSADVSADVRASVSSVAMDAEPVLYSVKLLDGRGRTRREASFGHSRGEGEVQPIKFNTSDLREGTYYLHIEGAGQVHKEQIIVKRK